MSNRRNPGAVPVPTLMADRFLAALARWTVKHKPETEIAIPTGIVTATELSQVLRALGLIQSSPEEN